MLEETLTGLEIKPDGQYLDGTFGRGGHGRALLSRLGKQGRLFAFDKDPDAIAEGQKLAAQEPRFSIVQGSFADVDHLLGDLGLVEFAGFDGILLDLGVSSPQLDDPDRGFSFRAEGPLDMRMNPAHGVSAAEWLAGADENEITRVLREFGEERQARRIARSIVTSRQQKPIATTAQLAQLIKSTIGRPQDKKHPATKSFQAIRIKINNELADLATGLDAIIKQLRPGGRLAVISFHSLEDRIVKRAFKKAAQAGPVYRKLPPVPGARAVLRLVAKAQFPSEEEISLNPRCRSAVLRVAEKLS
ncbi:MAG: 16S rRNA (cytosine(1402)-N(4))-methyltransferase RsmH [Xanthomonadales bacterium]|nr:16S rRNA (cytosine(1402)-N(4))-methyltransferase RsmH [Xanthomonadales bacterium]